MNEAIATRGSSALVLDTAEEALDKEINVVEASAALVTVHSDEEYAQAGEITKAVKKMQKKVTEYWEPLRVSAKKTYDDVLARKKEMLSPLESAEKILKSKMGDYAAEKERKNREREEAMRRLAQQEVERKLAEAAEAEAAGDAAGAEFAMAEAEVMDDISKSGRVSGVAPKAAGVSTSRAWKITNIDSSKVPVEIAGAIIRPVDEKAVMALIKATKGSIKIPGIEYEESVKISIRS